MMTAATPSPIPPTYGASQLELAVRYLARAVGRFETLLLIGLGASLLTLLIDAVHSTTVWTGSAQAYGISWSLVLGGIVVGLATAGIVLLVLIGLYFAISGLIAWRRGVWCLRRVTTAPGLPAGSPVQASVRDDRNTLIAILLTVLLAIAAGVAIGITDGTLLLAGLSAIPGPIANLAVGLVAGGAVVLAYVYGFRHLLEALQAGAPGYVSDELRRGQDLILAGAILGWLGSFSSVLWPVQVVSVVGIVLVLIGVERFHVAYDAAALRMPPGRSGSTPVTAG